jgi:hypothetical protein
MKKILVVSMFAAALSACSAAATLSGTASVSGVDTKSASQPYVSLRWARNSNVQTGFTGYSTYTAGATGLIEVENVAYTKQVVIHWDSNGTWIDAPAAYYGPITGSTHELWIFYAAGLSYMPYFGNESFTFAIRYTVNGVTVWDNNGTSNYTVWGQGNGGTLVPSTILGSDNLKQDNGQLVQSSSISNYFSGNIVLKNLAYTKVVNVVASTNSWKSQFTVPASFYCSYNNGTENWNFSRYLPLAAKSISYYYSYTVNGSTYLDNNLGSNYTSSY